MVNRSSRLWLVLALLFSAAPGMAEIDEVERIERSLLHVLTAEQVEAFLDGVSPESLELANGETLAEYLARQDRKTRSGLVLQPVDPCVVLDTSRGFEKIVPGVDFPLVVRGETRDLTESGGSSSGCGIPGVEGEIFRANRARALLLSIEIRDAVAPGALQVWPEGGSRSLATVVAFQADQVTTASSLIVPVCAEENADPCPEGDLRLWLDVEARVKVTVHGYLEPVVAGSIVDFEEEDSAEDEETESSKSLTAPFWEQRAGSADIYYTNGRVGIGTDSPEWTFGLGGEQHPRIELLSNEVDLSNEVAIGFGNSDRSEYFQIGIDNDGANAFHVGNRYLTSKHLSILPNGFVGVGHANPDSYLTVYGTAHLKSNNPNLRLSDSSVAAGDPGAVWNVRNQNSLFKIYEGFADGSPELVIDGLGNVGIGTSAPQSKLDIRGETRIQSSSLQFYNAHSTYPDGYHETQFQQWNRFALTLRSPGNAFAVERVDASGHETLAFFDRDSLRLGVRTSDPQHPLHVNGNARFDNTIKIGAQESSITDGGNGRLKLTARRAVGTSTAQAFTLSTCDAGGACFNRFDMTGGAISFRSVTHGEAMRITDQNHVGVGTTAPSEKLEVDGNIKLSGSLVSDGDLCIGRCN